MDRHELWNTHKKNVTVIARVVMKIMKLKEKNQKYFKETYKSNSFRSR